MEWISTLCKWDLTIRSFFQQGNEKMVIRQGDARIKCNPKVFKRQSSSYSRSVCKQNQSDGN